MFRSFGDLDYLVTGEVTAIRENGTTSLASFTYDDLGRRTLLLRGNGRRSIYEYDPVSRLSALTNTSLGSASDVRFDFTYNPASQIVTREASNDSYSWTGHGSGTTSTTVNGLNQIATINGAAATHDARGNLTSDPATGKSYTYLPSDNQLWTVSSPWTGYSYDTLSRLASINAGGTVTTFAHDGLNAVAEYDGTGALQKRYVFGPGVDEPLVEYDSAGNRRFLEADERGSIILVANQGGAIAINRYDEYGKPQSGNIGRFQYTGQMWLPNAGLYHYKLRALDPRSGRFNQTDPIGYEVGINLYAYVGNDPVNWIDPLGLCGPGMIEMQHPDEETRIEDGTIIVTAGRFYCGPMPIVRDAGSIGTSGTSGGEGFGPDIVISAPRPKKLSQCMIDFLASQGLASPNLKDLKFVQGAAGVKSYAALNIFGRGAITLSNVVYVRPSAWGRISRPSTTYFEEIAHSVQAHVSGESSFRISYAFNLLVGSGLVGAFEYSTGDSS